MRRSEIVWFLGDLQRCLTWFLHVLLALQGLPPLRWNDGIARIARDHAEQMASGAAPFSRWAEERFSEPSNCGSGPAGTETSDGPFPPCVDLGPSRFLC